jgi:hypothetical protein
MSCYCTSMVSPSTRLGLVSLALALVLPACRAEEGSAKAATPVPKTVPAPRPAPTPVTRPLLLLGIDGATWKLLDPLIAEGALPNFARVVAAGSRGPLKTYEPTLSPLIWTTIATGVGPRVHGIEGFVAEIPGTGETAIVTSNLRRVDALWNILSAQGTTVGVIGWWATYPAEEVNGFVISDQANDLRRDNYRIAGHLKVDEKSRAAGDPRAVWPPELGAEVASALELDPRISREELARFFALPEGRDDLLSQPLGNDEDILSIFKFAYLIDKSFAEAGLRALADKHPTFAAVYLNGLDAAEHHFWRFMEPQAFRSVPASDVARYEDVIRNYYVYVDEVLGRLLELYPLDRAAVVLVSDHGQGPNAAYDPGSSDHFNRVCSGTHEKAPDGVIVMAGADVARGVDLTGATVFDAAPTVLALLGSPVGEEMPGRPLAQAIAPEFLKAHPIRRVPILSSGRAHTDAPIPSPMTGALKEKLRGLGYIQ